MRRSRASEDIRASPYGDSLLARMGRPGQLAMFAALALAGCSGARVTATSIGTLQFGGEAIDYAVYAPAEHPPGPMPALLLLHGAGGNGRDMLPSWRPFADEHGLVLIAPTLSLTAAQETHVQELLPAIVDAVGAQLPLDPARLYAFGYSAGGYFAYDAATLLSQRFAAVAVFAMAIDPSYDWIVDRASRKTPVAIYIGDRDQFWTLDKVRRTRDLLASKGFPVHYVELPGQDHGYFRAAGRINEDAWEFFRAARLP
jgi:poly(3-hydroxybutyrate) depolymerase